MTNFEKYRDEIVLKEDETDGFIFQIKVER